MVVTVATIAGIVILAALGKSVGELLAVFGAAGIPLIIAYLTRLDAKQDTTNQLVNGRMSQMLEMMERFSQQK